MRSSPDSRRRSRVLDPIGGVDDESAKGLSVAGNIVTVTGIAYGAAFLS